MVFGRWVELIFGIVLPAVFIVPLFIAFTWVMCMGGLTAGSLSAAIPGLFFIAVPLLALLCLWVLILFGPEQVRRLPFLRWITVITGFLGLTYFFLVFLPTFLIEWNVVWKGPISLSPNAILRGNDWRLLLMGSIGPVVLGIKYLWQLIRRSQ